ncbi:uncharacterized protein [Rutidosis leptorrhynchoides]|uniref:uncharacterized protein n=1 Tax=Rutidosis leptorrhynchoides TaxID=125765 RepID=UPI003A9A08A5
MERVYDQLPPLSAKYTWLVAQNLEVEDGPEDQIFHTINDQIHYRCRIPELLGRRVRGYFYGWVILSNNVAWSLWNPVTCKIIHLPPLILRDNASIGQCCLSSPTDDHGSVLILTRTTKPSFVFCRLNVSYGNKLKWTEMSYGKKLKKITDFDCLLHCPTVFNGKVYALNTGNYRYVIQVDIVAKPYGEEIELLLFGTTPSTPRLSRCLEFITLLKGSGTELFYIFVDFSDEAKKTLADVFLFKWVMSSTTWKELTDVDRESYKMKRIMWKEIGDLKDSVFFVDLACDNCVFYRHSIASELGGCIHIRDDTGKMIYSYDVEDRTIFPSYMSFQASHLTLWDCSFEVVRGDSKQETNEDDKIIIRSVTDGVDESCPNYLPFHILEMIMELCVGVEYMHFRATCKHFRLAAPLMQWSNKVAMSRLQTYSVISPWLMVVDKNREIVTFTDPLLGDKYHMKRAQMSILDDKILCARFGWLVYYKVGISLVFCNPFTSEIHKLPYQVDNRRLGLPHLSNVCFSAPPISLKCTVVGFSLVDEHHVYLHLVAGERTWQMLPLDYGGVDPRSMRFPTFVGRDIYALFNNGELYVLRNIVNGQDYSWKKVVDVGGRLGQHFLVKSDQHLLLVVVSNKFGECVDVFKLNIYGKEWEKVDCLGRYMIYICSSTSVCIEAKTPEMENKIYFSRFDSKNGDIVLYSLETHKYHTFKDKLIREYLGMGLEHVNAHVWIEPSWSLMAN